jgi:voltage-gated potassium channel
LYYVYYFYSIYFIKLLQEETNLIFISIVFLKYIMMKPIQITELNTVQKLEVELILLFAIIIFWSIILTFVEQINYFDALYFSIITLAGIGYGDIVPHTIVGKIIVMFYALVWLPLFITMWYLISSLLLNPIKKTRKRIVKSEIIEDQNNILSE